MEEARRGRPRDPALDDAIVAITIDVVAELGFDRLTMDVIAERAGVAKTTLYRRWSSKTDLLVDVARRFAAEAVPASDTGDTRRDLSQLLSRIAAAYRGDSAIARIVADLVAAVARHPELGAAFEPFWADRRAVMEAVLRRGVERGELRADANLATAVELLLGAVYYRLLVERKPLGDAFVKRVVDLVWRSLAVD